jgi:hypothetical protein
MYIGAHLSVKTIYYNRSLMIIHVLFSSYCDFATFNNLKMCVAVLVFPISIFFA